MSDSLDKHVAAYEGNNLYDFDNEIMLDWYPGRIIERSESKNSILELGLGHGLTSKRFSEHFTKHTILEGSQAVINNFEKKYPNCNSGLVKTFFEEYESDETYNVIVMGFVLEHVDDPVQVLLHYKQFLAPDGTLFVAVPNAESLNRRLGHFAGMLPDMGELSENDILLGHKRYYTVASLSEDVQLAGYVIDKVEGIYLKPLTSSQMISLNLDDSLLSALCSVGVDYPELSCGILMQLRVKQ